IRDDLVTGIQTCALPISLRTLTAADGALTGATSGTFTVNVAAASKLAFGVQPTTTTAGLAISPAVTVLVQDQFGNTVTGDSSSEIGRGSCRQSEEMARRR